MNEKEIENVNSLRSQIADLQSDLTDFDILRWLHHYNNNFDVIVPKLRKNINLTNCSHLATFQMPKVMQKYYPAGTTGFSKSHDLLVVMRCLGKVDNTGLRHSVSCTDFFRFLMNDLFTMLTKIREYEKIHNRQAKLVTILDFQGLHVDLVFLKFLTTSYKITSEFFTENYGDIYGKFVAINLPYNAAYLWKLVKAVIPGRAAEKVFMFEHVDADVLPIHWGGQMVDKDGDEMCRSMITIPDKVPEDFYWKEGPDDLPLSDLDVLRVKPGKSKFVTMNVESIGSTLEWYCRIQGGYGIGVFYTTDSEENNTDRMDMVFPDFGYFGLGSNVPEVGKIKCEKSGFYKFRFNNKPSWISTTIVHYKIWCH